MKRKAPRVTLDTAIGRDVDTRDETVALASGTQFSDETADELVSAAHGRPSLGDPGRTSPAIAVRLPEKLLTLVDDQARAQGLTRSELIRTAIGEYLRAS